jgi:hypothetical protein
MLKKATRWMGMLAGLLFAGQVYAQNGCTADLMAGQNTNAGSVTVTNDGYNLYVTYATTGDWQIKKIHLYVGALAGLPTNNGGNPKIGNFPVKVSFSPFTTTYQATIPLSSLADSCFIVAAHAELKRVVGGQVVQTETGWAAGTKINPNNGGSWATYFSCCKQPSTTSATNGCADINSLSNNASVEGYTFNNLVTLTTATGMAKVVESGSSPLAYIAPNNSNKVNNACMPTKGIADMAATYSRQHYYEFNVTAGNTLDSFSLQVWDYSDWNPKKATWHAAYLEAYDIDGTLIEQDSVSHTTPASTSPNSSNRFGAVRTTGDACTSQPGQIGQRVFSVAGTGIVKVVLRFENNYPGREDVSSDPNLALTNICFKQTPVVQTNPCVEACVASSVVSFNQGLQKNGNAVPADRSDDSKALGAPQNVDAAPINFVSLGFGGEIVLAFECAIANGPGNDIAVFETTYGQNCNNYPERAAVYATQNGTTWFLLDTVCHNGEVDLAVAGLDYATQIKIVDVTPTTSISDDGYDVDGITCLNGPYIVPQLIPGQFCSPDYVVTSTQGLRKDGGAITAIRSNPLKATGTPEGDDTYNFFSLGYGGTITLGFQNGGLFADQPGDDFQVIETSFGSPSCTNYPEKAQIQVSQDGNVYYTVEASQCLDGYPVDFGSTGLSYIRYIRINDVTAPFGGGSTDAFDVDGVVCTSPTGQRVTPLAGSEGSYDVNNYVKTFPNPASDYLLVYAESLEQNPVTIVMHDLMGREILRHVGQEGVVDMDVDVRHLNVGAYILSIDVDGVTYTKKVLIRH